MLVKKMGGVMVVAMGQGLSKLADCGRGFRTAAASLVSVQCDDGVREDGMRG